MAQKTVLSKSSWLLLRKSFRSPDKAGRNDLAYAELLRKSARGWSRVRIQQLLAGEYGVTMSVTNIGKKIRRFIARQVQGKASLDCRRGRPPTHSINDEKTVLAYFNSKWGRDLTGREVADESKLDIHYVYRIARKHHIDLDSRRRRRAK